MKKQEDAMAFYEEKNMEQSQNQFIQSKDLEPIRDENDENWGVSQQK
jgi:hypothetical protein